jgi:hypothetical protein
MISRIQRVFSQLQKLERAYDRLLRAVPDISTATRLVDERFEELLRILDAELSPSVDDLIQRGRQVSDVEGLLRQRQREILAIEAALLSGSVFSEKSLRNAYELWLKRKVSHGDLVKDYQEFRGALVIAHAAAKEAIEHARPLSRKDKKQRKRNVAQGLTSLTLGVGMIIADTQLPPMAAFSYAVGAGAVHQAIRDLVGEAPKGSDGK